MCVCVCPIVQAGGASSGDGLCKSSLDVEINAYDQRTEVCFGSIGEVRRFEEYLYGNSPRFSTVNELEVRLLVFVIWGFVVQGGAVEGVSCRVVGEGCNSPRFSAYNELEVSRGRVCLRGLGLQMKRVGLGF